MGLVRWVWVWCGRCGRWFGVGRWVWVWGGGMSVIGEFVTIEGVKGRV